MKKKTISKKLTRKQRITDLTGVNLDPIKKNDAWLQKQIKWLDQRLKQLEKWQRDVIGGGDFSKLKKIKK